MHKFYLLASFCFFSFATLAQNSFKKFYGASSTFEVFTDVVKTTDGFVIAGTTGLSNGNGDDFWLIKTDESGNILWEKTLGGPKNDLVSSIALMPDGGFLVAGKTQGADEFFDGWLVRTDANGNQVWEKTLDNPYSNNILDALPTPDGGYLVSHENNFQTHVRKLDSNGNELWSKQLFLANIFIGADGNYYVLSTESGADIYKFTPAGALVWEKQIMDAGGNALVLISISNTTNGLLVAGITGSAGYLTKIDFNGNSIWQTALSGDIFINTISELNNGQIIVSYSTSIELLSANGVSLDLETIPTQPPNLSSSIISSAIASDGNVFSVGINVNADSGRDAWLSSVSVDNTLSYTWNKIIGDGKPNDNEIGWSVIEDDNGTGFLIGANLYVDGHHNDFYVLKTDKKGNVEWEATYGNEAQNSLYSATATTDGGYILTGRQTALASIGATAGLSLKKINNQGALLWEKHYTYPGLLSLYTKAIELPDQSLMVVYAAGSPRRLRLMKTNASGDSLWTKVIGTSEQPRRALLKSSGTLEITGSGPSTYGFLISSDLQGNVLFNTPLTGNEGTCSGLVESADNKILVSGGLGGNLDSLQVTKFNGLGNVDWAKTYNPFQISGTSYSRPTLVKSSDGNYIIVCASSNFQDPSQETNKTITVLKINPVGDILWEQRLSIGSASKTVYEAIATADGGFAIVGTEENGNSDDIFLMKINADGTLSTNNISKLGQLDLSPNPSNGPLNLRFESAYLGKLTISFFDAQGQLVQHFAAEKTSDVFEKAYSLPTLPSGAYFVRISTENGRSIARNWVKY